MADQQEYGAVVARMQKQDEAIAALRNNVRLLEEAVAQQATICAALALKIRVLEDGTLKTATEVAALTSHVRILEMDLDIARAQHPPGEPLPSLQEFCVKHRVGGGGG